MKVGIPSPLLSYTKNARQVEASGETLGDLFIDLDRRYPGIRFRFVDEQEQVRRHVRVFVNGAQVFDLGHRLDARDAVHIVQALSGG